MFVLRRSYVWLLAVALATSAQARPAEVDKLLPDNTEFVLVVNVKQIIEAPLIQKHALEELKGMLKSNEEVTKILESLGFDPFKDLASVTIAGAGIGPDVKLLVIAHGRFDPAKVDAKADDVAKSQGDILKVHKEGDRKIYEVKAEDRTCFVGVVDKSTLVGASEKEAVMGAFAKASGQSKAALTKELQGLIEKADAKQSVWFVVPGSALAKSELTGDDRAKKNIEKIDSVTAGLTLTKDVSFNVTFTAKSADAAKELLEEFKQGLDQAKGLLAIFAGQMKELGPAVDLVNELKLDTVGDKLVLKADVTDEQIEKAIKKQ